MEARGLAELEIEEEGVRVRLVKTPPAPPQVTIAPAAAAAVPGAAAAGAPAEQAITSEDFVLKSPIVGTFYRAPSPEVDPFVEVGDEVGPETAVCIIEAMKVMNEIKAETTGMVREILVENAHAVEYGQPLFVLEPRPPGE
jgi:acetyl-CoA carboxylase biotin carboxyl carrier protein